MKIYFAHPIETYGKEIEETCVNTIKKHFSSDIINPKSFASEINKISTEKMRMEFFYKKIEESDIFIYLISDKITIGVRKEVNYALSKNKKIYRLKFVNDILTLIEMTYEYIYNTTKFINETHDRSNWSLKTKEDYLTWFKNNPEVIKLIKDQFDDENSFYVPHYNTAYMTEDYTKTIITNCKQHSINNYEATKHGFVDTRFPEAKITCPFFDISSLIIGYDTYKLPRIKDFTFEKLLECQTVHRNMRICKDHKTILGAYPTYDLDIRTETKKEKKNFFTEEVFNEYLKTIDIMHTFMENNWNGINWNLAFSGNGIYIIMEKLIYKDHDINEEIFFNTWKNSVKELEYLLLENGIKNIVPEKKYGWQRYFKAIGTFHLSKERVSIPLNKDEILDYKWMNEITKIENGLTTNIFNEIINRAGNSWR